MAGGIRVIAIYATFLQERGHDVNVVSVECLSPTFVQQVKNLLKGRGLIRHVGQLPSYFDSMEINLTVFPKYSDIVNRNIPDADIVIATWWQTAECVNALNSSKGTKIYFIQGHEVHDHLPIERTRLTYRLPLHKIVVSRWLQNIMSKEYGDTDVDLVPNSVDHNQFFSELRGKQPVPTVGFLFSNTRLKGVDITNQVINKLRDTFPNLRVISFGSAKPMNKDDFSDQNEFYYSPLQDKLRDLYAQCDVWITTSRTEGFNLPAMEAMACRTPVVSTKTGWPEEAVVTGLNGILADVDDVESLTQGALSILSLSDEEWRRMSMNAFNTVATSSWENSANQFEKALENAYRRNQNPAKT